ncbi:MAG: AbiV family abortive infection protein [Alphaproteobacteria bacterium]|nr:AbiV family abortive infection protein [Alphaproteobacteria bacterium]
MEIDDLLLASRACLNHAKSLLDSATVVKHSGHSNIAYHLAALALEEIGRMELLNIKQMAHKQNLEKDWIWDAEKNHVKKLLSCLFSLEMLSNDMTPEKFKFLQGLSLEIHQKRLAGLYVGQSEDGLKIPSEQITTEEAENLISLANLRISMIGELTKRTPTPEEIDNQTWFLRSVENTEKKNFIFSKISMDKLKETANAGDWVNWLKAEFQKREDESNGLLKQERQRLKNDLPKGIPKWKIRIKLYTTTHTIKPSVLREWNKINQTVQLIYINRKDALNLEIIFNDDVSVDEVYRRSFFLYSKILLALNIASMGFWFSEIPPHAERFYDDLEDLELKAKLLISEDKGEKKNGDEEENRKRVFDKKSIALLSENFSSLPDDIIKWPPLHEYMKGLVLLAKHNVHFKSEIGIFSNFLNALYGLMLIDESIKGPDDFEKEFSDFYDKIFPDLDEKERFLQIIRSFRSQEELKSKITYDEAFHMKLYCDAYFLNVYKTKIFELAKNIKGDALKQDIRFSSDNEIIN